jgi:hypothetical protein
LLYSKKLGSIRVCAAYFFGKIGCNGRLFVFLDKNNYFFKKTLFYFFVGYFILWNSLIHDILPKPVIVAYISELEAVNRSSVAIRLCGWSGDADANGSRMIRLLGLSVIQPGEPNLLACPIDSGLQKAPVKLTL